MASLTHPHLPAPPVPAPGPLRAKAVGQGSLTLAGLGAGLLALRAVSIHAPACPFRTLTGVPCPGCGMTRLADAVVHGRLGLAFGADPAGVVILGVIAVLAGIFLIQVVVRKGDPPRWMQHPALVVAIVGLVGVHWATTVFGGGLLPS